MVQEHCRVKDFPLQNQHKYDKSPFAVVWSENTATDLHLNGDYPVCTSSRLRQESNCVHVVMKESRFNLRPMDHHVYRLEAGNDKENTAELRLRLRDYGKKNQLSVNQ